MEIENCEGLQYLDKCDNDSVELVLTDPPYITSRKTGMQQQAEIVQEYQATGKNYKTEEEWKAYKTNSEWENWLDKNNIEGDKREKKITQIRNNYLKYGSIYGKKYAVITNYGDWDKEFTMEQLALFIHHFYRVLKPGGTLIIWFDIWKITTLKELMENVGFKQNRFLEWIKTNPQPLNSSRNYLTNCREIALLGVKKSKPTFNSKYDNAIYQYPLQGGKNRCHPTQKSLALFIDLIKKHSNEGDKVMDTFLGSGTTALACQQLGRKFKGCELNKDFFDKASKLISGERL